ncbi:MAG TPA: MmgE/PrpD family protein, partial [Stellaceae bacterium]|nr:MmgE/PrpD family protein [Stellaceae bacterium]
MTGFTLEFAEKLAALARAEVPAPAQTIIRRGLADWVGVTIAGSSEPAARAVRGLDLAPGPAHLIPSGVATAPDLAALVNGVAGHVLDYDDVALDGHPSAVLFPALLAEAERLDASEARLLRAYLVGYEAWAGLRHAAAASLHGRGWHPSGIFGAVAAAVACAALGGLDAGGIARAIGLGAAEAGGLIANFGSMAKSYQVGRVARAGVVTARLAQAGMGGAPDILEHPLGLFAGYAGGRRDNAPDGLAILTEGLAIKLYPICYGAHRIVDATLELAGRVRAPEIERITIRAGATQLGMLRNNQPTTTLEAKFSAPFAAAAPLLWGRLGQAELAEANVRAPATQDLMRRTALDPIAERAPGLPFAPYDQVVVQLRDGRTLESRRVTEAVGAPS